MIITFNWLREYIKTKLNTIEIIQNLEKLGFNLKKAYLNNNLWNQIEIIKIIDKKNHPNANKLSIYKIEKKTGEILEIVCGDQDLQINDYVPYAKPGVIINNIEIKTIEIRGIQSKGMLCSASEINLPIDSKKVLKCFKEDYGKSIADAYDEEGVFEIEVTPNRGDALSIKGIARILANENLGEFIDHIPTDHKTEEKQFFKIESKKCKALNCVLFEHKASTTPHNIQKKLQLTNHTIFNIDLIDYTNYISHALGQPMHVFDYDKIKNNQLKITETQKEEEFITLTGQKIKLTKDSLVFKSGDKIISWPSIIGGENSKVDNNTKTVLLETGIFQIDSIQRRKLQIHTFAAKRTEYGLDPESLNHTINTFLSLINEKPIFSQNLEFKEKKEINFRFDKIKEILGINISQEEFEKTMKKKGFKFNDNKTITPPSYKFFDINTENCLIEEFANSIYENLESINLPPKYNNKITKNNENILATIAINEGFNECKNISITNKESEEFKISETKRKILNASNQNYSILKGTLIPDLLKNLSWHINNKYKIRKLFEISLIYEEKHKNNQQKSFTAISTNQNDIRKLLTKILSNYDILNKITYKNNNIPHSNNSLTLYINNDEIGVISTLKESILNEYNIKECYSLELNTEQLEKLKINIKKNEFTEQIPIYKDFTIKLNKNESAEKLLNFLNSKNYEYEILTIYPSNNIKEERKITIKITIKQEKTLNKIEISEITNKIEKELNSI